MDISDLMQFFKNINVLPDDIISLIYLYIPKSATIFLNRENYLENHHLIRQFINKTNIEKYIRSMVRQDNHFVFELLLDENHIRWINMKRYYYKECIYANYLNFLDSYAIDNQSTKCRKIIVSLLEKLGLNKNQHKKKTIRYIRWRT